MRGAGQSRASLRIGRLFLTGERLCCDGTSVALALGNDGEVWEYKQRWKEVTWREQRQCPHTLDHTTIPTLVV